MTRTAWIPVVALAACGLGACTASTDDLQQWMSDLRRTTAPKVTPLAAPTRYQPLAYAGGNAADAFSSERLTQVLRRESGPLNVSALLLTPELNRRKEPLEAYPLDAMTMVGSLDKGGQWVALVRVDTLLHQVRTGNYLGQNYGRVTKISESDITLREIVQDAAGEWIERRTTLELQENTK
ncbi:pilus assembly protein PilP [Ottowia sp.]|uniref:pilus assembly protein PilP n=1 Tax=Ottowia sp. TaxID=1898956 RepID=UPI002BCEC607|nr:pilus assembly protein PilP [Ottowia sp.]HPZ55809.1 pilus assembly protein PilP [Ottowia sp.]HQD48001.1 pilus assembly protein PilP [Ottowia sp.]